MGNILHLLPTQRRIPSRLVVVHASQASNKKVRQCHSGWSKEIYINGWLTYCGCRKEENPQLDGRYWELLRDILSHFVVARASDRIPAIRVPLILAFAAVFNNYSELRSLHHEKVLSLYRAVHDCLGLLSQPTFTFAYRPPIDQLFTTFEYLISVIDEELNKEGTGNEILLAEFVKMANLIMPQLEAHMLTSANQRKVGYRTMCDRS